VAGAADGDAMPQDRDFDTELLRLRSEELGRLVAAYSREIQQAPVLDCHDIQAPQRPTLGDSISVCFARAIQVLGLRDLFGPRLASRFLEQAGRRAIARLGCCQFEDVIGMFRALGIGLLEVVERHANLVVVEERECAICSGLTPFGEAACAFEAGMLAGALEATEGRPVRVVETKCCARGDEVCRFEAHLGVEPDAGPEPLEVIGALAARAAEASRLLALLQEREKELRRLATTDELTGLSNRRVLYERMAYEIERHKRYGRPLALLVTDIDHFKAVNDTQGHQAGDRVLSLVARCLAENTRATDLVARHGGEEFAVLMGETSLSDAAGAAERLRRAVGALRVEGVGALTVSIGVAGVPPVEPDLDALMAAADAAMYAAKRAGRNRVAVHPAE